jgi:ankyrin repeat protein
MNAAESKVFERIKRAPPDREKMEHAIWNAARKGWNSVVREILKSEIDVNSLGREHQTLLGAAAAIGADHVDVVRSLLDAGADPNGRGVMRNCGPRTLPLLLKAGGNVNGNFEEANPLMFAIQARTKEDKALALIAAGAETNVRDVEGTTPLMLAAQYGRRKTFDALLNAGADTLAVDSCGRSVTRRVLEIALPCDNGYRFRSPRCADNRPKPAQSFAGPTRRRAALGNCPRRYLRVAG